MSFNEDPSLSPQHLPAATGVPQAISALEFVDVVKVFGDFVALNRLNLTIPKGSFYGIVGPNGAGKTTAITIACGLLRPTEGTVKIAGHDMWAGGAVAGKTEFGLLADGLDVFDRLTGSEYLDYLGRLRKLDDATITERASSLLAVLGLDDAKDKMVADYSAGMKKKILLAGAMLHRPSILILDEPLESVDPVSAAVIREVLHRYVDGGGTVVISSHVMELVENMCDHVALISDGIVRASGTLDEVRQGRSLAQAFVDYVGGGDIDATTLEWLRRDETPR